jgi:outer membrane murein-binding lipoprotein Lpp
MPLVTTSRVALILLASMLVGGAFALGHAKADTGTGTNPAEVRQLSASIHKLQLANAAQDAALNQLRLKIAAAKRTAAMAHKRIVRDERDINRFANDVYSRLGSGSGSQNTYVPPTGSSEIHTCADGSVVALWAPCPLMATP